MHQHGPRFDIGVQANGAGSGIVVDLLAVPLGTIRYRLHSGGDVGWHGPSWSERL